MVHKIMDSPILDKLHSNLNTIKECEVILEPLDSLILDDSPEYINYLIENGFVSCDSSLSEQERYAIEVQDRIEDELRNMDWDDLGNEFRDRIYQYRDVPYLYPKFVLRFLAKSGFHGWYLDKILCQLNEACLDFGFSIDDILQDIEKKRISASKVVSTLPTELNIDEAKKYFSNAIKAGFMDNHYQWMGTRYQAALFAEICSEKLNLKYKWKPFNDLWDVKYLAQARRESKERFGKVDKEKEIEALF